MNGEDWDTGEEGARAACEAAMKEGRLYRVSYPKSGDPKKNFYGRHCRLNLRWKYFELREIKNGDYKTYEELNKADDRLIRKFYFDGRVKEVR